MPEPTPTLEQIETLKDLFLKKLEKEPPTCDGSFHPKDIERVKSLNKWLQLFLEQTDLDMKQALNMLWETCTWRKTFGTNDINENNIRLDYMDAGAMFAKKEDINGKYLIIIRSKLHQKGTKDMNELIRILVYWIERIQKETNYDQLTLFFDMQSAGLSNMDMDFTKRTIDTFKYYYPNSLNYIIIYEMPWILNAAFKIIKGLLPPKAVARMKFLNAKTIKEFIPDKYCLKIWGGTEDYEFKFIPESKDKNHNNTFASQTPKMNGIAISSPSSTSSSESGHNKKPSFIGAAITPATFQYTTQQDRIMNPIVPVVTCQQSTLTRKIRRKTDSKPQSQINKCNNEKRRRELENNYIEQLGEFLQLNKRGDMTTSKPDKAAILNQVVKTYRDICDKRSARDNITNTTGSNTDNSTFHPVQQEKISSTESLLSDQQQRFVNPEISAYFETLEHYVTSVGWILLQINPEGIIESCTQNIKDLIGYHKSDLIRQPIYSYLHPGDHAKLSPILNNMLFNLSGWDQDESQHSNLQTQQKSKRSITTKVRMLVKHNEESSETIEEKQQRQENYEEVVFIAAPIKDDGDDSSSVLCLITRPEDDSPLETNMQQHIQQRQLEQMTLKLDVHGKIMEIDTSALRPNFSSFFSKERGTSILDLCHVEDLPQVQTYLNKLAQSSTLVNQLQNHNASFRLRLGSPDVYVHVKASSRLFVNCNPGESDYIMSVQTVVNNDNDLTQNKLTVASITSSESMQQQSTSFGGIGALDVSNFNTSSSNSNNNNCNTSIMNVVSGGISSFPSQYLTSIASVGGPLMTSVINSEKSLPQVQTSSGTSNIVSSFSSPPSATEGTSFFPTEPFEFDYMHSPFQLDVPTLDYRPASRTSVNTPVSTPRPPSGPTFSPVGNECPSPLTPHHISKMVSQASPQNNANSNLHNNNLNSVFPNFPFQNYDDKDSKEHINNNIINKGNENNNNNDNNNNNNNNNISKTNNEDTNLIDVNSKSNDSERLRNLLTKRTHSSALHDEQDHKNRILKGLLNADEEKEVTSYNKSNVPLNSPKTFGTSRGRSSESNKNQMLLQLLNDKSEDENPNRSRQSELLKQLQKDDTPKEHTSSNNPHHMAEEDLKSLLRIQDVPRKRPLNEPDDGRATKRTDDKKPQSSNLRERNKMLASLLSNPAKAPTSIIAPVLKIIPDITSSSVNREANTLGMVTSGNISQQQQANYNNKQQNAALNHSNSQENSHLDQNKNQLQILSKQNLAQQDKFGLQSSNSSSDLQKQQMFPISTSTTSLPVVSPSSSVATGSVTQQMTSSSLNSTPTANTEVDPELSEILNDVIDIVPEPYMEQSSVSTTPTPSNQDINEKMAITIIQRSLMQMDQQFNNPPAYSQLQINQQNNQQRFQQPPPMYQSRSVRMGAPNNTPSLMQQRYHENSRMAQLHEKERLLQQQMKQHVVMSENAVRSELALNPNISLLNTVAPNVSLTRGIPNPDTHPSTNYSQGLMNQQLSPGQRNLQFNMPNPAAYQSQYTTNQGQRLSPQQHQQKVQQVLHQQQQQQQQTFQSGNTQLSPRLPAYGTQSNIQNNSLLPPIQASSLQGNQRWTASYNPRQFLNQRRNSTIDSVTRQNSLPSQDTVNFPGPSSPNTTNFSPSGSVFNAQLQRIQRQASAPQPNQHLGGPNSRSAFGGGPDNPGGAYSYGGYSGSGQQQQQQTVQPNSEYVRQELRQVVSTRAQQQQAGNVIIPIDSGTGKGIQSSQSPIDIGQQNSMICANSTNPISPISTMQQQQQQQQQHQQLPQQQIQRSNTPHQQPSLNTPTDNTLNFNFDLPAADYFGGPSAR